MGSQLTIETGDLSDLGRGADLREPAWDAELNSIIDILSLRGVIGDNKPGWHVTVSYG